jgi:eukaryotic-like serine/threonine-protein kinase
MRTALSGRYAVEREIGRGGMATVYLARDLKHDRQVAIKVLAEDLATTIGSTRFLREIRVAAQLLHPNILGLIDSGEADGSLYYIMPYVRGETLRDKLDREKRLSVSEAVRIAREVAGALEHAHEYGVIHRDIKPENILLVNGHHAAVADFGLARAVYNASSTDRTTAGLVLGSVYYMSPEQATGEDDIDGRTDIYSLGCVLFEMLTGSPPFQGKTVQSVLTQQLTAPVPRLRTRRADLTGALDEMVQRTLAKDPGQRLQSAHEFSRELAQISIAGQAPRAARARNWLYAHRRLIVPASLAAGAATLLLLPFGTEVRNRATVLLGAELDTARYVVLPFRHPANVSENFSAEHRVHEALQRWDVDVIDQWQVEAQLADRQGRRLSQRDAKSIALRYRAGRYVMGDVSRSGDSLRVDAAVYDTRTGTRLYRSTPVTFASANVGATSISKLAVELIFRGAVHGDRPAAPIGTSSYAAYQAYLRGQVALAEFNLATADSSFAKAVESDPDYASAYLWLAQVRAWLSDRASDWQGFAERAAAGEGNLTDRERQLVAALIFMANGQMPEACKIYGKLKAANPLDFVPTYGIGECNRLDSVVVEDPNSASGWSFRSSAQAAAQAYREAFQLVPGLHKSFQSRGFDRVRSLMYTAANIRRRGKPLGDTTTFRAAPSWLGDTLAFVPYPQHEEAARPGRRRWHTTVEAVDHQRGLFREIAASWRSAYAASPETLEAMAVALELQGDSTAIDTLRAARRMTDDEATRRRLAASEVLLLLKFGVPDNAGALGAARTLADSLLRTSSKEDAGNAEIMASLAAMTGRAHTAARLARRTAQPSGGIGARTAARERALLAYASMGAPADSIRRLEQNIVSDIRSTVAAEKQPEMLFKLLNHAAGLSFPVYSFAMHPQIVPFGNVLLRAQLEYVRNNPDSARAILVNLGRTMQGVRPADRTIDVVYPVACLLVSLDDPATAMSWLEPVLNGAPMYPPDYLSRFANAGAFMRALLLRAELARRSGDAVEAARWERPVDILWANADPGLKEAIKASHRRLAPATAAR